MGAAEESGQTNMSILDELTAAIPTKTLYHYTDANGFLGIFQAGSIWATSAYHLNDVQEFRYAIDLITGLLIKRLTPENRQFNTHYSELAKMLDDIANGVQVFVSSFSEEGDLLSQWLAYSGPKNGYAIGFGPEHFRMASRQGFRLVRCVYKKDEQEALASKVIDVFCEMRSQGRDVTAEGDDVHDVVMVAVATMKHPGFEREAEWRLIKPVIMGYEEETVYFRQGRSGIVPYLKASLVGEGERFNPDAIYLGPNDDMDAAVKAAMTLLYQGEGPVLPGSQRRMPIPSKTPYRP